VPDALGAKEALMKAVLLVLTNPGSPDQREPYNQWYTNEHIPDVLEVPGYLTGTRFRAFPGETAFEQEYLAIYELEVRAESDLRAVSDEHMQRIARGEMRRPPDGALDRQTVRAAYYTEAGEPVGDADAAPGGVFLVFSDPVSPERESEYNRWYQEIHLPEVVAVPGFTAASRYVLTDIDMLGRPWAVTQRYLAVYHLATDSADDYHATIKELRRRIDAGELNMSDAIARPPITQAYGRITPVQRAKS
jgi:hypothetical protein